MTHIEKVKHIRATTMAPMNKINNALKEADDNVDVAIDILIKQKAADVDDMANRKADNTIVYSYVHSNKVGALVSLACQTDFVAKNEMFLQLAKDICMHVVSNPNQAHYVDVDRVPEVRKQGKISDIFITLGNKPPEIREKIVKGKLSKWYDEICLCRQKFVKDDSITLQGLINKVSAAVGEKIEIKEFVRLSA